jgi:hypothetical protein
MDTVVILMTDASIYEYLEQELENGSKYLSFGTILH